MARKCLEGECWSLAAGAGPGVNVTVRGMWHQIFFTNILQNTCSFLT